MSGVARDLGCLPCSECLGRQYCIVDVYRDRRDGEIADGDEAFEVELAVEAIRRREDYLMALRLDLEARLRNYSLKALAESRGIARGVPEEYVRVVVEGLV